MGRLSEAWMQIDLGDPCLRYGHNQELRFLSIQWVLILWGILNPLSMPTDVLAFQNVAQITILRYTEKSICCIRFSAWTHLLKYRCFPSIYSSCFRVSFLPFLERISRRRFKLILKRGAFWKLNSSCLDASGALTLFRFFLRETKVRNYS